jgi:four helix bundle protein
MANSKAQSFRDLKVWQRSMELTIATHRLTKGFPREEVFALTSQMRRSAVSVPSNIAEGFGRMNRRELKHFFLIARASNCELQTQLEIASLLGMGDPSLLDQSVALSHEVGKNALRAPGSIEDQERLTTVSLILCLSASLIHCPLEQT